MYYWVKWKCYQIHTFIGTLLVNTYRGKFRNFQTIIIMTCTFDYIAWVLAGGGGSPTGFSLIFLIKYIPVIILESKHRHRWPPFHLFVILRSLPIKNMLTFSALPNSMLTSKKCSLKNFKWKGEERNHPHPDTRRLYRNITVKST